MGGQAHEHTSPGGIADLRPLEQEKEQKAWYWYDWANSAYMTTVGTVFFAPYIISRRQGRRGDNGRFDLGRPLHAPRARSSSGLITASTILSALLLPPLGAYADRTANKKGLLAFFAWTGAAFAALIFFATGDNWQLAAVGDRGGATCASAQRASSTTRSCR